MEGGYNNIDGLKFSFKANESLKSSFKAINTDKNNLINKNDDDLEN